MAVITDALRKAIDEADVTLYRIAKDSGLDYSALSRFYHGERSLTLDSADKLAECLGVDMQLTRSPYLPNYYEKRICDTKEGCQVIGRGRMKDAPTMAVELSDLQQLYQCIYEKRSDAAIMRWFDDVFPDLMKLIPRPYRKHFLAGVKEASDAVKIKIRVLIETTGESPKPKAKRKRKN